VVVIFSQRVSCMLRNLFDVSVASTFMDFSEGFLLC
jgi:hypothetical protein